ncbi:MAG: hypothetical protein M1282_08540 [Chloroflexi bacterium]|nr:hypothetical protein [Chloroflexota bacterium]
MNRRYKIILIVLIAMLLILAIPVRVECGVIGYACATGPDPSGTYYTYYEIKPLGITAIETIIHQDLGLYYSSGNQAHSVQQP